MKIPPDHPPEHVQQRPAGSFIRAFARSLPRALRRRAHKGRCIRRGRLPLLLTLASALPLLLGLLVGCWLLLPEFQWTDSRLWILFALWVACTAVAACVGHSIGQVMTRRLARIDASLKRMQRGHYRNRLRIHFGDEIDVLASRVNALMSAAAAREKRILRDAVSDPLTRLPNRTLVLDRVRQAVATARRDQQPFAVLLLNLDRFKFVNDTLGHTAGDALLKEVARRLRHAVREGDTVARLGGDEFVLLIDGDETVARDVANRVHGALREPVRFRKELIDVGASIGIAPYPRGGSDEAALLRSADAAMYKAKRQQSSTHVFDGDTNAVQRGHLSLLGEMRTALERDQFELDFQPKMSLKSGLIVGLEGLVRWRHPVRGRVPPGEFIPFAEQTGFMRELTRWVVAEGASFARQMHRRGFDLTVSINISAQDIESADFCDYLIDTVRKHSVQPEWLCLEITESGVVTEIQQAMDNLKAISKLGFRLSVDDFGTGYATLAQLRSLPVSELKIDRSFVSGMEQHRGNRSIVRSTIDLAQRLGLSVVAEGVETVEDLRGLARLGCDEVQGYYLAKPMRADDVASWIEMRHSLHATSVADYAQFLTSQ